MSIVKLKALPKWMPDSALDSCPYCNTSWGFFFRRHHCRICGGLVCAECSQSTHILSLLGEVPQRVCDYCDKAVRSAKEGAEVDELDDHLAKISEFLILNVKPKETVSETAIQTQDQNQSVVVGTEEDQIPLEQESSVVGSTQSTSSTAALNTNSTGPSGFMADLINTPDAPAPAPQPAPVASPQRKELVITPPSDDSLTAHHSHRGIKVSTNASDTPSGRLAQKRAQFGSLKKSITRPTQHGANITTLQSQGASKLKTLKRNQLETLIKQAQVAAVVQEFDPKNASTSTDNVDVNSLLTQSADQNGPNVIIDAPAVDSSAAAVLDAPKLEEAASSTSSAPYSTQNITQAGRYTLVDLFNSLWSKSPPLIIDTRDVIRFNIAHVPFAIHIPITEDDIDFESNTLKTPLSALASRIPNMNDQRAWRMRKGRAIVVVGQGPADVDITAKVPVNIEALLRSAGQLPDDDKGAEGSGNRDQEGEGNGQREEKEGVAQVLDEMVDEYEITPHFVTALFASACVKESVANSVDIVSLGAQAFVERYPFLVCSSMNARHATLSIPKLEQPDPKHQHIPRFPAYPNEIIDQCVFLGSQADSEQRSQMEKLGITHVINATADLPNAFEGEVVEVTDASTKQIVKQPLFSYLRLAINDTHDQPLLEQLDTAFEFIDKALAGEQGFLAGQNTQPGVPGKVLVHCQMGISRSASIVTAYIMRSFKCDLYNALAMVKSRRSQVLPNPTFVLELAKYECQLFGYGIEQSTYKKCMAELYPNGIPAPKK